MNTKIITRRSSLWATITSATSVVACEDKDVPPIILLYFTRPGTVSVSAVSGLDCQLTRFIFGSRV